MTGGFSQEHLEGDIYRVSFGGNGYTTRETVQTYWLFRCAELALENGYDGFRLLSSVQLSGQYHQLPSAFPRASSVKANFVYIPIMDVPKPMIEADIMLLKGDIQHSPPKDFDARLLKENLDKYVNGEKCEMGNVCKHVKPYLYSNLLDGV